MKTLYLLRHAHAVDANSKIRDFERYLTEKGEDCAKLMGTRLKKLKLKPDLILSSPASRAIDTAIVIAGQIGYPLDKIAYDKQIYEAGTETLLKLIHGLDNANSTVLMCGHNPSFSDIMIYFGSNDILEELPKCGIAGFSFNVDSWKKIKKDGGKGILFETPKMQKR